MKRVATRTLPSATRAGSGPAGCTREGYAAHVSDAAAAAAAVRNRVLGPAVDQTLEPDGPDKA